MSTLTLERCDSCGSAAYVRFTSPEGLPLSFCGHHARRHTPAFADDWLIYSELARLEAEHGPNRAIPAAHA